jgi:biotin carboxylase
VPGVVFVAPYFLAATSRFLASAASLPGVTLGLVTHEVVERVPAGIRDRLAAHYRVDDALDSMQLRDAVRAIQARMGSIDCLMGPLEELQVPMAEVRATLGIAGIDVATAHNFRDKDRMKRILNEAGLPCAKHRLVGNPEEAISFIESVGLPVVAKPPSGSGSRNTFRLNTSDQVREWLQWSPPEPDRPTLLEEFVLGEEFAFDCVFVDGRPRWWNISRYHPSPLEVMENSWIQWAVVLPRDISGPEYRAIGDAGPAAIAAFGLQTGLVHMEWFRRADGSIAISEAAVRPPGAQFSTLISYAHDFDLYNAWARLMIFGEFDPPARRYAVGAAYLRGQGDGRVRAIQGLEQAQERVAGLVVEVRLPEEGQTPTGHYEGEGYVIVRHPDTAVVEEAVAVLVNSVKVELA